LPSEEKEEVIDPREENRDKRRDKEAYRRKHGMRVVGQSVKKLAEVIRGRSEKKVS
jgi:hypothetical protein